MAKKSNKTEHVLKLITKNEDAAQDDVFFAIEEITENGTSAMKSQIIADNGDMEDEIESGLDQLMGRELPDIRLPEEQAGEPPELTDSEELPELETPSIVELPKHEEPKVVEIPETKKPPEPEFHEAGVKEEPAPAAQEAEPAVQESPTMRAFREQENSVNMIPESAEELINIAEVLAREKLALVMDRMKVCTCKTCVNDVLALALNTLPTKYVTTDAGKQYFQRDEYKKQYETEILAALTKACVRVKAAPRH